MNLTMMQALKYLFVEDPAVGVVIVGLAVMLFVIGRRLLWQWRGRVFGWYARVRDGSGIEPYVWDKLNHLEKRIIRDLWVKCKERGVILELSSSSSMPYGDNGAVRVSGYFMSETGGKEPRLGVAVGVPLHEWMTTLLHEWSHMDQWHERSPVWDMAFTPRGDVYDLLDNWVSGACEVDDSELWDVVQRIVSIESDCERRTLAKMRHYNGELLPYVHDYVRKANSYVWSYYMVAKMRKWYDYKPYRQFEVWGQMPDSIMEPSQYLSMPERLQGLYMAHCYGVWGGSEKKSES